MASFLSEKADAYPVLAKHIGTPINTTLIPENWDDLPRLGRRSPSGLSLIHVSGVGTDPATC